MADTRPTEVSCFRAIYLCILLLFAPSKFQIAEDADNKFRSERKDQQERERSGIIVRRAFWGSLVLVTGSGLLGLSLGLVIGYMVSCVSTVVILGLQVGGAMMLLWGTLFILGWEIETWSGVTFTERVNQWLYRFLYCTGTSIIVLSLALLACS